jgi:hypothetical protein
VWDETLKNSQILIVLCGSYIGMMETEVLGYQRLCMVGEQQHTPRPMDLALLSTVFSGYSAKEKFITWAVVGVCHIICVRSG